MQASNRVMLTVWKLAVHRVIKLKYHSSARAQLRHSIVINKRRDHFTSLRPGDMMFGSTTTVQNDSQLSRHT